MEGSGGEPKRVKAKSVRAAITSKTSKRETWARICFYYPQYTLETASKLSARDIKLLLKIATQIEAERYYNFTQIAAAPHSEKGKGVKELTRHYSDVMKK